MGQLGLNYCGIYCKEWGDHLRTFGFRKRLLPALLSLAILPILPILATAPAYAVGAAFTSKSTFSQENSGSTNGTGGAAGSTYYKLNIPAYTYSVVGSNTTTSALNAMGWNPTDNYLYALSSTTALQQIASDGTISSAGAITGLTVSSGASFITNDKMIVSSYNSSTLDLLTLNRSGGTGTPVTGGTATAISVSAGTGGSGGTFA